MSVERFNPLFQTILYVLRQMLDVARGQLRTAMAKERTLLVMVVGIPNVGKSCLINTMSTITRENFSGCLVVLFSLLPLVCCRKTIHSLLCCDRRVLIHTWSFLC